MIVRVKLLPLSESVKVTLTRDLPGGRQTRSIVVDKDGETLWNAVRDAAVDLGGHSTGRTPARFGQVKKGAEK